MTINLLYILNISEEFNYYLLKVYSKSHLDYVYFYYINYLFDQNNDNSYKFLFIYLLILLCYFNNIDIYIYFCKK